jgi:hypothetical protein
VDAFLLIGGSIAPLGRMPPLTQGGESINDAGDDGLAQLPTVGRDNRLPVKVLRS